MLEFLTESDVPDSVKDVVDVIEVDSKSEREVSDYVYEWIGIQMNK